MRGSLNLRGSWRLIGIDELDIDTATMTALGKYRCPQTAEGLGALCMHQVLDIPQIGWYRVLRLQCALEAKSLSLRACRIVPGSLRQVRETMRSYHECFIEGEWCRLQQVRSEMRWVRVPVQDRPDAWVTLDKRKDPMPWK